MKLVRSWPTSPPGNPHVVDGAVRLLNDRYDYSGLAGFDDDIVHLDWDMAVSREDLVTFAELARQSPGRVLVAPYPMYPDARKGLTATIWAAKRYEDDERRMRYVETLEPTCHIFGFGMVYLPADVLRKFVEQYARELAEGMVMDDVTFSGWHYRHIERETPIAWQVRPVHLHYDIATVL